MALYCHSLSSETPFTASLPPFPLSTLLSLPSSTILEIISFYNMVLFSVNDYVFSEIISWSNQRILCFFYFILFYYHFFFNSYFVLWFKKIKYRKGYVWEWKRLKEMGRDLMILSSVFYYKSFHLQEATLVVIRPAFSYLLVLRTKCTREPERDSTMTTPMSSL